MTYTYAVSLHIYWHEFLNTHMLPVAASCVPTLLSPPLPVPPSGAARTLHKRCGVASITANPAAWVPPTGTSPAICILWASSKISNTTCSRKNTILALPCPSLPSPSVTACSRPRRWNGCQHSRQPSSLLWRVRIEEVGMGRRDGCLLGFHLLVPYLQGTPHDTAAGPWLAQHCSHARSLLPL